jgi:hypothetical protein
VPVEVAAVLDAVDIAVAAFEVAASIPAIASPAVLAAVADDDIVIA